MLNVPDASRFVVVAFVLVAFIIVKLVMVEDAELAMSPAFSNNNVEVAFPRVSGVHENDESPVIVLQPKVPLDHVSALLALLQLVRPFA